MDTFVEFIKSDVGVSVAWISSTLGIIFSLLKVKENKGLKKKIVNLENISIETSKDNISQKGNKNVYTKNNSGDMNIKM